MKFVQLADWLINRRRILPTIVLCLTFLVTWVQAQEVLQNGDFETGSLAPWSSNYSGNDYTKFSVTSGGYSGSYCMVGTQGWGVNGTQAPIVIEQISRPLLPNTTYTVSWWYKTSWSGFGIVDCRFYTDDRGLTGMINIGSSSRWSQVEVTFTTSATTSSGGISLNVYQATFGDKIYFDDFSITKREATFNNGGFENSTFDPWQVFDNGEIDWGLSNSGTHWGNNCLVGTGGSTAAYESRVQWNEKEVHPDSDYRFSLWVKNTGNWGTYGGSNSQSWFKAVAEEADASGNFGALGSHDLTPIETSISGWTRLGSDFTTGSNTTKVRISLKGHLASPGDVVSFDDIALTVAKPIKASYLPFAPTYVSKVIAAGADITGIPLKDNDGLAYYPSNVSARNSTYGDGKVAIASGILARDLGALWMPAIPPCMDAAILAAHPDWRRVPNSDMGCLVSPYGDYLIEEVKELASIAGADGVTFDGYNYLACSCSYCTAKFKADTGLTLPTSVSWPLTTTYKKYIQWQDTQLLSHYARMRAAAKAIYPKFEFYIWSTNAGRYGHYLTTPRVMPTELNAQFDCSMQEWWADESNIGLSAIPDFGTKYLGAVSRPATSVSEAYLFTHAADLQGVYASSMPEEEVQFRQDMALSAGSLASIGGATEKTYMQKAMFDQIEARRTWTNKATSMPWAAILVSEPTRQFYGQNDPVGLYMNNCFGFYAALREQHFPVDLITENDLRAGRALQYKVLILPNTACMSSSDVTAVKAFVSAGGGLVATGATSLYDELGVARSNYGLYNSSDVAQNVIKVSKNGSKTAQTSAVTISESLFSRNSIELGKMLTPTGRTASYVGELFPVTVSSGGSTWATVNGYPAYVTSQNTGAGKVAFFSAAFDGAYFKTPYTYEAVLLRDAVNWVAPIAPPVTVVGPKSLQVDYYTQKSGKRWVIHLLNGTNSSSGRASAANDVPVREEIVPMRNVEVWFNSAVPTSVRLQPDNLVLTTTLQSGKTLVMVPELTHHAMVVAEMP